MARVQLSVIRILRLRDLRIRDFNRRFGGLQVAPRLRFACCVADAATEAPLAAARDVDDAAPLVTAEGRLAATWAEKSRVEPGCRASLSSERLWSASGCVMPLALVSGIKEAEPHLVKQLLSAES
jgi:hypothetical protein